MTTITNRGDWRRDTTVAVNADRLTAYHVREFVKHLDDADIPDDALIEDRHSHETLAPTGLFVRVTHTRPDEVPE